MDVPQDMIFYSGHLMFVIAVSEYIIRNNPIRILFNPFQLINK